MTKHADLRRALRSMARYIVILGFGVLACSGSRDSEATGSASAAIVGVSPNFEISVEPTSWDMQETSSVTVPSYDCDPVGGCHNVTHVVVGYNESYIGQGWSVTQVSPIAWQAHTSDDSDPSFAWPHLQDPDPSCDTGGGDTYLQYSSDPSLAYMGRVGQVAYAALYQTQCTRAPFKRVYVAVLISTDGGYHFPTGYLVSTDSNPDEPRLASDVATGDLFVMWRDVTSLSMLFRRLHTNPTGVVTSMDPIDQFGTGSPPQGIGTMTCSGLHFNPGASGSIAMIADSQQSPVHLYFAYPDHGSSYRELTGGSGCSTVSGSIWSATTPMSWYSSVATVDPSGQLNFGTAPAGCPALIHADHTWPYCTMLSDNSENRAMPSLAWVNSTNVPPRLVSVISQSVTRGGDPNPADTGTRAVMRQSTTGHVWSGGEYPLCGPFDGTITNNNPLPSNETYCLQYGTEVAAYGAGGGTGQNQIGWAWKDTRDNIDNQHVSIWAGTLPPGPEHLVFTLGRLTPLGGGVPWTQTALGGNTQWGDYEGMSVDPATGTFYATWGDDRTKLPDITRVYAASFQAP